MHSSYNDPKKFYPQCRFSKHVHSNEVINIKRPAGAALR